MNWYRRASDRREMEKMELLESLPKNVPNLSKVLYTEDIYGHHSLILRFEALIETTEGNTELWAWDSSHGGGFWHQIDGFVNKPRRNVWTGDDV